MDKKLTDKKFWLDYWKSKNIVQKISKNYSFSDIFNKYLDSKGYKSMIEIGGFPGNYAIYFKKFFNYKATLLDNVVDNQTINRLLKINGLKNKDIEVVESDFFRYKSKKKFDVVFSLGFIEHFTDTKEVLKRHWNLVKHNGTMIIGLPNFLGINGLYQKLFDPLNLSIHNLNSMETLKLIKIINGFDPIDYEIFYENSGLVWLENLSNRNLLLKFTTRMLNSIGEVFKIMGIKNKYVSTHIFIIAQKK